MKRTKPKPRDTHYRLPRPISPYGISEWEIKGVTTPLQLSLLASLYSLISHIPCEQYYVANTQPRKYRFIFSLGDSKKKFIFVPTIEELVRMYREVLHASN